jgi:hypothetical protein
MFRVEVCAEHKIELTQRCISNATNYLGRHRIITVQQGHAAGR